MRILGKKLVGKKILVTGGTGFVGSHLVEDLAKLSDKITVTVHHKIPQHSYFESRGLHKKTHLETVDLIDFKKVNKLIYKNKFDFVFHLAAQPLVEKAFLNPKQTFYSNIVGTINLLESIRMNPTVEGIVVASSDKAYGILDKNKYSESDPLSGRHPYEVSKSATDLIAYSYFFTYGLPVCTTRFGNIYGEGDIHYSRLIPGIMRAFLNGKIFQIRSNGKYVRDYLYVKDVTRGYIMLANEINRFRGEAFNFGSEENLSVIGLIQKLEKKLNLEIKYHILDNADKELPYQSLDFSKVKKKLGWKPEFNIESTAIAIFEWYKNNND